MNFKLKLHRLVSHINGGLKSRSMKIKHPYSKNLEKVLKLLTVEGAILGFQVTKCSNFFFVYLKGSRKSFNKTKLVIHSKVSRLKFLSDYELKSHTYHNNSSNVFISSDKGIFVNTPQNLAKFGGGEFLIEVFH